MIHRVGLALVAAALLGTLLIAPTPAHAKFCSLSSECAPGASCVSRWNFFFFQLKECKPDPCNTDSGCTRGSLCLDGICQVGCRGDSDCPAANRCTNMQCVAPSPQPAAGTIPGEGRKCNPPDGSRPPGWATDAHGKPLGACPQGTVCSNRGFCQRLLQ